MSNPRGTPLGMFAPKPATSAWKTNNPPPAPAPAPAPAPPAAPAVAAPSSGPGRSGTTTSGSTAAAVDEVMAWAAKQLPDLLGFPEVQDIVTYLGTFDTPENVVNFLADFSSKRDAIATFAKQFIARKNAAQALGTGSVYIKGRGDARPAAAAVSGQQAAAAPPAPGQSREEVAARVASLAAAKQAEASAARPGSLCECQATIHGLLTNCLRCGKIICDFEAGTVCTFCLQPLDSVVNMSKKALAERHRKALESGGAQRSEEPAVAAAPAPADAALATAVAMKDRLLNFDRTVAARTRVLDDQEDYFSTTSTWSSEKEKAQALAEEKKREDAKRRGNQMRLTVDFSGRSILEPVGPDGATASTKTAAATGAAGGSAVTSEWPETISCAAPAGDGMFANASLRGRAADVYNALLSERSSRPPAPRSNAMSQLTSGSSRVQHDFEDNVDLDDINAVGSRSTNTATAATTSASVNAEPIEWWDFAGPVDAGVIPTLLSLAGGGRDGGAAAMAEGATGMSSVAAVAAQTGAGQPADGGVAGTDAAALCVKQPYASLICAGIQRFLPSNWDTAHRGRLWIVSTHEEVTPTQIRAAELFYAQMFPGVQLPMPTSYPAGSVIGCVDVQDSLSQAQYRLTVLDATSPVENHSPFLWLCEAPHVVATSHPMKRTWEMFTDRLQALPRSSLSAALPDLVPMDGSWRPKNVLKRQVSADAKSAEDILDIGDNLEANPNAVKPIGLDWFGGTMPRIRNIAPGIVVLREFLPMAVQCRIVSLIAKLGVGRGGFYLPTYDNGAAMHLRMMCLGLHWNPQASVYEAKRGNFDNASAPAIPGELKIAMQKAYDAALRSDPKCGGRSDGGGRKQGPATPAGPPPPFQPDVCIVNFYTEAGHLGLHQDKDESKASLRSGRPVISFSIGLSADFEYSTGPPQPGDTNTKMLRLDSGDVIVFGGPARMVYHGITRVHPHTMPEGLPMIPGRLNLTFRQHHVDDV